MEIKTQAVFRLMSENDKALFMKTSLYKHHFSSELVVWERDKSTLAVDIDTSMLWFCIEYDVFRYEGFLRYEFYGSDPNERYLHDMIEKYLHGEREINSRSDGEIDARYYKNHPDESIALIQNSFGCEIKDYAYCLKQGIKPRMMVLNTRDEMVIPDYIVYLHIICGCDHSLPCRIINVPKNVLFLLYDCDANYTSNDFISCRSRDTDIRYILSETQPSITQEFYNYTFKRAQVKSANTCPAGLD